MLKLVRTLVCLCAAAVAAEPLAREEVRAAPQAWGAAIQSFRPDLDSAVSYFVKGSVPEDHGFALQPWSAVRFGEQHMAFDADSAVAMGNYYFTDAASGAETKVNFTIGYAKDDAGRVRIAVHHSSLPYAPHP